MSPRSSRKAELDGAADGTEEEALQGEGDPDQDPESGSGGPPPGSGDPDSPGDLGGESPDAADAAAERDAYLADLQRVTAEFTNFRRQTIRRNTELVAQAASGLAKELLPVLDACEAAVSQGVEGIEAVQSQLLGVLSAAGLEVLGEVGEPFDPGFHEAVISEDLDGDDQAVPVVAEILRTGYAWNGRVLRPAMVKVRG